MEFSYTKIEGTPRPSYRPVLPVTLKYHDKEFRVGHALVDTGADITIFPLEVARYLGVAVDDTTPMYLDAAGGGSFIAFPSLKKITYSISKKGFRSIEWEGTIYFAQKEPTILLGYYQCLEYFDLTFQGPERIVSLLPRL